MVLTALIVVAARSIDATRLLAVLRAIDARWIAPALLCYLAILPLWALLWRLLAPPVERNRIRPMLGVVSIASSTHNTTAFMVGEATSVVLLVSEIGLAKSAAVSVIAMDQLLVGLAKLAVLSTAASFITLPSWMVRGIGALSIGVALLLGACLLLAWRSAAVASWLPSRATGALHSMGDTLAPLRSPTLAGAALALALAKKFAEVLAIVCVQHAFGVHLPFASAILVLAALNLATLVPVVPGNLGVFEGAVTVTSTYLGVPAETAVGIAIVTHACYLAALTIPGYVVLARSAVRAAVS